MNKREFLADLAEKIDCLPPEDIGRWLDYYSEMIDDRVEDGMSEEQAVYAMGNVYDIATQIMIDTPIRTLVKTRVKPTRELPAWVIALIVIGAVVWLPMLAAAMAVVFSVYVTLWSLVLAGYIVAVSFSFAGILLVFGGGIEIMQGTIGSSLSVIGAGLFLLGFGIVLLFAMKYAAKACVKLTKAIWRGIKKLFIRKETFA